ncbi:L-lactate dehydrogenase, partial [Klebsiella pneumoniae]|nr:L-lactate dehydrogenase [Klebsiella pneumoniae]
TVFLRAPPHPPTPLPGQVGLFPAHPRRQGVGPGVWLNPPRLRRLLAQELEIGAQSIDAFILGEHGDTQFPVWSHSSVYGTPIADLYQQRTGLPLDREAMADKVRKLGFEIYAGKGCTEYGVAGTLPQNLPKIFSGRPPAPAGPLLFYGRFRGSGAGGGAVPGRGGWGGGGWG